MLPTEKLQFAVINFYYINLKIGNNLFNHIIVDKKIKTNLTIYKKKSINTLENVC